VIEIQKVCKWYGDFRVLHDCTTRVAKGEVVVVCGPSGSGKSTLVQCVNGLEPYQGGEIRVDGILVGGNKKDLPKLRARVGMVFQHFELFPHLSVTANLCLAQTKVLGRSLEAATENAMRLLDRVGLKDQAAKYPGQLSGGQQQRVGIARAVAMGPKVLLLDEITSALDPELVGEVLTVVQELAKDGMTMIVVTHEMTFARDVSTRIVFMDGGRIQVEGTPREVLAETRHDRLKGFLARIELKLH
jgi:glutamate/aspartate transport system ATP-binding protein